MRSLPRCGLIKAKGGMASDGKAGVIHPAPASTQCRGRLCAGGLHQICLDCREPPMRGRSPLMGGSRKFAPEARFKVDLILMRLPCGYAVAWCGRFPLAAGPTVAYQGAHDGLPNNAQGARKAETGAASPQGH